MYHSLQRARCPLIFDPMLIVAGEIDRKVRDLLASGRLYFLQYKAIVQEPDDFDPLVVRVENGVHGVICTAAHINSQAFSGWLGSLGVAPAELSTTSVSNPEAFMMWVMITQLRRPDIGSLLVDPPKSTSLAMSVGGPSTRQDRALYMPTAAVLREYFLSHGTSPTDFEHMRRAASPSASPRIRPR